MRKEIAEGIKFNHEYFRKDELPEGDTRYLFKFSNNVGAIVLETAPPEKMSVYYKITGIKWGGGGDWFLFHDTPVRGGLYMSHEEEIEAVLDLIKKMKT